jgi:hypothetical protein
MIPRWNPVVLLSVLPAHVLGQVDIWSVRVFHGSRVERKSPHSLCTYYRQLLLLGMKCSTSRLIHQSRSST